MTIVRTHYRYKRPPRKRAKTPAIEVPAVVTISDKTRRRKMSDDVTFNSQRSEPPPPEVSHEDTLNPQRSVPGAKPANDRKAAIKIASADLEREPARTSVQAAPKSALGNSSHEGTRSAIVTARRPGKRRYADVPEMTEEEHKRRGDAADALFQEIKRQIAEKVRKP